MNQRFTSSKASCCSFPQESFLGSPFSRFVIGVQIAEKFFITSSPSTDRSSAYSTSSIHDVCILACY